MQLKCTSKVITGLQKFTYTLQVVCTKIYLEDVTIGRVYISLKLEEIIITQANTCSHHTAFAFSYNGGRKLYRNAQNKNSGFTQLYKA